MDGDGPITATLYLDGFSINAARVDGDMARNPRYYARKGFSINAARVDGDQTAPVIDSVHAFSINAARVDGDAISKSLLGSARVFQSTPPVWTATAESL